MKLTISFLFLWNLGNIFTGFSNQITISRTASDKQIVEAENQCLRQFGFKTDIQVVNRNSKSEITNLKCICFDKSGKESGSCESDNFGKLVIIESGVCAISDK